MTEIQTGTDAIRAALSAGNKKMNISIPIPPRRG